METDRKTAVEAVTSELREEREEKQKVKERWQREGKKVQALEEQLAEEKDAHDSFRRASMRERAEITDARDVAQRQLETMRGEHRLKVAHVEQLQAELLEAHDRVKRLECSERQVSTELAQLKEESTRLLAAIKVKDDTTQTMKAEMRHVQAHLSNLNAMLNS
ncbi:hypothetical protein CYMTET_50270 [Cymbomonas tetramitiformis]|uniref:Uncharacterized protein n=1 Tax=Cymbomonas tetramitiformis TaxID=36881 RepID=A0AAE0EUX6_9CHLO|nr:hypothetical protein CYMTET_50270 [Cymbomonas tetramitiformis]